MSDGASPVGRLLEVVEALDPAAARELRGGLPRCDSTFGLGLAFFLAATAGGARAWLGPGRFRRLERLDGGALVAELEEVLAPRRRRTADGREWRVLRIPVTAGAADGCHGLLCAIADGPGSDGPGSDGPSSEGGYLQTGSALVLQMRLPALGAVQLVAAGEGRRFDVTLCVAAGLSAAVLADMQGDFADAMVEAGLKGDLTVGPLIGAWLDLDDGPDGALGADLSA